jgi:pyridoxamine 5'-phosphate oxidase
MLDNSVYLDPLKKFVDWYLEAQIGKHLKRSDYSVISFGFQALRKMLSHMLPWLNFFRPDIATLATVTLDAKPSARSVLFQGLVDNGFSFYTDYESEKGKELDTNPWAVMVFYWNIPPRQVRIDGKVYKLPREAAERYWESRTRANQAASSAFKQSSVISSKEQLLVRKREIESIYRNKAIPCPDSWGGYKIVPEKLEFWEGRVDWLHDREKFSLIDGHWSKVLLAP